MNMLIVGFRYGANLVARVAEQQGYAAAMAAGGRYVTTEVSKLPKFARLAFAERADRAHGDRHPTMYSNEIITAVESLEVEIQPYSIAVNGFWAHIAKSAYPFNYAAGPMDDGGMREQKVLEYFVSLDLLAIRSTDVVVDVASEWSVFPEIARKLSHASVYRQDLIYAFGIHGDCIGGSAAQMPVPNGFADKLVLHNAFEHFEGTADTDFITEAYRVLRPGGLLCILPLFMSDRYSIVTDPLVDRRNIVWDDSALIVELPWWHNRFGRFYDAAALQRRVLEPASRCGFRSTIYHIQNVKKVHPRAYLHFALVLQKPGGHASGSIVH